MNYELYRMGLKRSDKCVFCKSATDKMDHMVLYCSVKVELCGVVEHE